MLHDVSLLHCKFYSSWWPWPPLHNGKPSRQMSSESQTCYLPNHRSKNFGSRHSHRDQNRQDRQEQPQDEDDICKGSPNLGSFPQQGFYVIVYLKSHITSAWLGKAWPLALSGTFPATQHHQGHVGLWRWPAAPCHHNWVKRSNPHASGRLHCWSQNTAHPVSQLGVSSN